MTILQDVDAIVQTALRESLPDAAVKRAIGDLPTRRGKLVLVAIGKASWQMAKAAWDELNGRVDDGIVVVKRGYSRGPIGALKIREGGHPVPDEGSYAATDEIVRLVQTLGADDLVLFLVSGGGSALFEAPIVPPEELDALTRDLLACGANIVEINMLRKRLSAVKGGKFAQLCAPTKIFSIVLSDVLGDPLDAIASGPAYPDGSTCAQALAVVKKYGLKLSPQALRALEVETPKSLDNVETRVTGSARELCASAKRKCEELGYKTILLTDALCCEAREAGSFLASIARSHANATESLAFIVGGEPIVHLTGSGLGGRAQELALAAAIGIDGLTNCAVFSVGSDGTDGPTDAAGGVCDGGSAAALAARGIDPVQILRDNDAYRALKAIDALIVTGPTGTNVNDLTCLLIRR